LFESPLVPVLLIGAVMYLLVIRPQMQERQAHEKMLASLKKDDKVVLSSGIWGTVSSVEGETLVLDLGGASLKVDKSAVARLQSQPAPAK
jgi:preprotein translocase subunit YajC